MHTLWGWGVGWGEGVSCGAWGRALTRTGFYLANMDRGHTVGISDPDQADTTTVPETPRPGAFHLHPHSDQEPAL